MTPRTCATCGAPVVSRRAKVSKATQIKSAPKNRAIHCNTCRYGTRECPVCQKQFTRRPEYAGQVACSPKCGGVIAARTRAAKKAAYVAPAPEWRGSAIDRVRAIRGEVWV